MLHICSVNWSKTGVVLSLWCFFSFVPQQGLHKMDLHEICSSVQLTVQERQLQCHAGMLASFRADLSYLQQNLPEGKKAKARELEEHRVRAEYLQHEVLKVMSECVCIRV